jgi:hypothetical protein
VLRFRLSATVGVEQAMKNILIYSCSQGILADAGLCLFPAIATASGPRCKIGCDSQRRKAQVPNRRSPTDFTRRRLLGVADIYNKQEEEWEIIHFWVRPLNMLRFPATLLSLVFLHLELWPVSAKRGRRPQYTMDADNNIINNYNDRVSRAPFSCPIHP